VDQRVAELAAQLAAAQLRYADLERAAESAAQRWTEAPSGSHLHRKGRLERELRDPDADTASAGSSRSHDAYGWAADQIVVAHVRLHDGRLACQAFQDLESPDQVMFEFDSVGNAVALEVVSDVGTERYASDGVEYSYDSERVVSMSGSSQVLRLDSWTGTLARAPRWHLAREFRLDESPSGVIVFDQDGEVVSAPVSEQDADAVEQVAGALALELRERVLGIGVRVRRVLLLHAEQEDREVEPDPILCQTSPELLDDPGWSTWEPDDTALSVKALENYPSPGVAARLAQLRSRGPNGEMASDMAYAVARGFNGQLEEDGMWEPVALPVDLRRRSHKLPLAVLSQLQRKKLAEPNRE
jgi:hypothetical protein